ncbi:bifunctional methylenetetrahydrofolate dehydrogenase/methenyltetrahydrofolate cyclohydrolase FolD [Candidatus Woesearchaeota archaeon]|nr:bifunctional methylenetetrahydrofolate dehydrogenase/methenyltetrahydrofolate cyclohydrolase FolD [Candidatus Woesearchaeota archaeon]
MIINGKEIAEKIRQEIKAKADKLKKKPGLAVILVGDDPASQVYVRGKEKTCNELGFYSEIHRLDQNISEDELLNLVKGLNNNDKIHGILVQLPLPKHIDKNKVISLIKPIKDVDGLHPLNIGNLFTGHKAIIPCTPKGIVKLIESTGEEIQGRNAVVVGRSNLVGKPVSVLLLNRNATVTICHSRTQDLKKHTQQADILVAAVGKPEFITADMIKQGAIVIDVGINRIDGKLIGDVDFENVKDKCSFITPVPGGVGPMTIAMLMENTIECYEMIEK